MRRCTEHHITSQITSNCPERVSIKNNIKILQVCVKWALDTAKYFGVPKYAYNSQHLSNNWDRQWNLHVDDNGVLDYLWRALYDPVLVRFRSELTNEDVHGPIWTDVKNERKLARCVGGQKAFDLKLLCSPRPVERKRPASAVDSELRPAKRSRNE